MRRSSPLPLLLVLVGLGLLAGTSPLSGAPSALPDATSCQWEKFPGESSQGHFHAASAMDPMMHRWYFYGGRGRSGDVSSFLGDLDLMDPDIDGAQHGNVDVPGRLQRYGAVGAFQWAGESRSAYWIGGGDASGIGQNTVHVFDVDAMLWQTMIPSGPFNPRLFHAGAYDPGHDTIVVHGGTDRCSATGEAQAGDCQAGNFGTSYLNIGADVDVPRWQSGPPGGPGQVLGHTMVYDKTGGRMIVFGGSRDGTRTDNDVWQLDVSPADFAVVQWSRLETTGPKPAARLFHGAALDRMNNRMIVYGGVTRNAFLTGENAAADTWALNLDQTPAQWVDLDATVGARVGAVMSYDENHEVVVLHGGRGRYQPSGVQDASRESHWLNCEAGEPTEPPTPIVVPTDTPSPTWTEPVKETPTPTPTGPATATATATVPGPTATPSPTIEKPATEPAPTFTPEPTSTPGGAVDTPTLIPTTTGTPISPKTPTPTSSPTVTPTPTIQPKYLPYLWIP